jgi:membrane peptidoglycan carboxypeptidase
MLAGLAQSPTDDNPYLHPDQALQRRSTVLQHMVDAGVISAADAKAAAATPLGLRSGTPVNGCAGSSQPYFCDWVLGRLRDLPALGATQQERIEAIRMGGLVVRTTLQPATQDAAQAQAVGHIPVGDPSGVRDALAVVQPGTGAVLAMAQDTAYGSGAGQTMVNYAVDQDEGGSSGFQVGSTFKAFTLAAAFGKGIPLDTTIDAPASGSAWSASQFGSCQPVDVRGWHPTNVPGDPSGPMSLTEATAKSVNTAFIALEGKVGLCQVRDTAVALGMHSSMSGVSIEPVPSLTLGPYPVSPLTMAASYAAFAADGRYCQPTPFVSVTRDGQQVAVPGPQCSQAVTPDVARTVTRALEAVITEGTGTMAAIGRPAAGKTGTTDDHAATWFAGYTPQVATAVWVGNPDGTTHPMTDVVVAGRRYAPVNGGSIAAPIWRDVMSAAVSSLPVEDFAAPGG